MQFNEIELKDLAEEVLPLWRLFGVREVRSVQILASCGPPHLLGESDNLSPVTTALGRRPPCVYEGSHTPTYSRPLRSPTLVPQYSPPEYLYCSLEVIHAALSSTRQGN